MNVAKEHNFQTPFNNPIFSDNSNKKSFHKSILMYSKNKINLACITS